MFDRFVATETKTVITGQSWAATELKQGPNRVDRRLLRAGRNGCRRDCSRQLGTGPTAFGDFSVI